MPPRRNNPAGLGFGPMRPRSQPNFQRQARMPGPMRIGGGNRPNPGFQARGQQGAGTGGNGLLSRLLGRGKQTAAAPTARSLFSPPASATATTGEAARSSGGLLASLTSSEGGLSSMIANTQKVLNTAQQVGPMVQQYGPIVKNLPAMWKIYRGFKDSGSETAESNTEEVTAATEVSPEVVEDTAVVEANVEAKKPNEVETAPAVLPLHETPIVEKAPTRTKKRGDSAPRLYI